MKQVETERKFLLKSIPDSICEETPIIIEDIRVNTGEAHPHIRLRRQNEQHLLTKKYPKEINGLLQMIEETIELSKVEFDALNKDTFSRQIKKRFSYIHNQTKCDLDIWLEDLSGLAVIEFEFPDAVFASKFQPPDFCLVDITNIEWLAGGMLSGKKYQDLEPKLSKLGYKKLVLV